MHSPSDPSSFHDAIDEHIGVIEGLRKQESVLHRIAEEMTNAILTGHKVLWCGNGGSAADSQHLAAELMGRFRMERSAIASIALTTDSSVLTAVSNDYGYEMVFQRQVEALCNRGDVVVGISTSGSSKNVYAALQTARELGAVTIAFSGEGGKIAGLADIALCVPSKDTARVQEAHIVCGHLVCDWVERCVAQRQKPLTAS